MVFGNISFPDSTYHRRAGNYVSVVLMFKNGNSTSLVGTCDSIQTGIHGNQPRAHRRNDHMPAENDFRRFHFNDLSSLKSATGIAAHNRVFGGGIHCNMH
jgi:hypothetical protein